MSRFNSIVGVLQAIFSGPSANETAVVFEDYFIDSVRPFPKAITEMTVITIMVFAFVLVIGQRSLRCCCCCGESVSSLYIVVMAVLFPVFLFLAGPVLQETGFMGCEMLEGEVMYQDGIPMPAMNCYWSLPDWFALPELVFPEMPEWQFPNFTVLNGTMMPNFTLPNITLW